MNFIGSLFKKKRSSASNTVGIDFERKSIIDAASNPENHWRIDIAPDNDLVSNDLQSSRGWSPGHQAFLAVVQAMGENAKVGMEIGVAFGANAENLLINTRVNKLYAIDSYMHRDGYDDPMNAQQERFNGIYLHTLGKLSRFGPRCIVIRTPSLALSRVWVEKLDFIFIDAEHSYESVREDILAWLPHVRVGGRICGHDYNHPVFPGVAQAVHEIFDPLGWRVEHGGEFVWSVAKLHEVDTMIF